MKMELRFTPTKLKSETDMTVAGYVNKTEQPSEILGSSKRFIEKIAKGAFTQAIKNAKRDIDFLSEHSKDKILASTKNNSLVLEEDEEGLFMSATIAPTSYGKDSYELIKSGIFKNMSFGFRTISDSWKRIEADLYERTIEELELFEVSVVKDPAYSQSTISARGFDSVEEVEVPDIEIEAQEERDIPLSVQESRLKLEISKKYEVIQQAESRCRLFPDKESFFKRMIENENKKIDALKSELVDIKKQWEEIKKMKNEKRELQTAATKSATSGVQVSEKVVEKLEHTSSAYESANKVHFEGETVQIPIESGLGNAEFVETEDGSVPELELALSNFESLTKKRVGASMFYSKKLMSNAGFDLSVYTKNMITRLVSKALEKSIIAGKELHEFKGIVPNPNVESSKISAIEIIPLQLKEVTKKVHEDFLANSCWYMSRPYFEKVLEVTDETGNFILKNETVNGRVTPTLFGYPIDISEALDNGDTTGQVPVLFGSIEDCYTIAISKEYNIKNISGDTTNVLRGSVGFVGEMYADGTVTNYQAIAKAVVE